MSTTRPLVRCPRRAPDEGVISSWDLSIGVDGPGTRFVIFTAGCPLRCLYCQNPETWRMRDGRRITADAVMNEIDRYRRFISVTRGGITISGGEPLLQPRFTAEVLRRCHDTGLHTALDTSGLLGANATDAMLADTDLVLLDIKSFDPAVYRHLTGGPLQPTLRFARRLADLGTPVWIRFVVVPGLTDAPDDVDGLARFVSTLANVERVDILPFHRMAMGKYQRLGLRFPLADVAPPCEVLLNRIHAQFRAHGVVTA
ncbi:pyruvate formate-lyase-activating protein [Spongiactinospora sp. TRM90649]|uniref:pyruvate formate-lyase-activating protein n=1 Tax=Spongiactinospora sp. TRM90649 TaxID=3031114 RepID=UPI0023F92582|nr:pyruvate formate-lyase-activating protein [Spongiactinospora sp. TRM90649]MDF5755204.1 pyruvate formate-lyase-activating protein [Spongiactinospora sp. TRM90649]